MLLLVRYVQQSTQTKVRHHQPLVPRVGPPVQGEPRAVRHGLAVSVPEGAHVLVAVPTQQEEAGEGGS